MTTAAVAPLPAQMRNLEIQALFDRLAQLVPSTLETPFGPLTPFETVLLNELLPLRAELNDARTEEHIVVSYLGSRGLLDDFADFRDKAREKVLAQAQEASA